MHCLNISLCDLLEQANATICDLFFEVVAPLYWRSKQLTFERNICIQELRNETIAWRSHIIAHNCNHVKYERILPPFSLQQQQTVFYAVENSVYVQILWLRTQQRSSDFDYSIKERIYILFAWWSTFERVVILIYIHDRMWCVCM